MASISSSTLREEAPGGSSCTTTCHCPRASRSMVQRRAHAHRAAAVGVGFAHLGARRDDLAAAGEVRALDVFHHSGQLSSGSRISAIAAFATSVRLWLGISVAMPTAMPEAPFSSTTGRRAGSTCGSCMLPS